MQHFKKSVSKFIKEDVSSMNHQHTVFLSGHSVRNTKKYEYFNTLKLWFDASAKQFWWPFLHGFLEVIDDL